MITLVRPSRGQITQAYGNIQPDGNPHTGNDYAYTDGDSIFPEVFAAAAGTVVYAGDSRALGWPNPWYFNPDFDRSDAWDSSAGNVIVIAHPGYVTTYSHLESWTAGKGDVVSAGQRIGTKGNTGNSYGKHLHFEVIPYPFNFGTATYGRTDPNPHMTGGGLAAAGSITPEELKGFLMALTDKEQADVYWQLCTEEGRNAAADRVVDRLLSRRVPLVDATGKTSKVTGTTTPETKFAWMAHNDAQNLALTVETLAAVRSLETKLEGRADG